MEIISKEVETKVIMNKHRYSRFQLSWHQHTTPYNFSVLAASNSNFGVAA